MTPLSKIKAFRDIGTKLIAAEAGRSTLIPLRQDGVVFQQMFEYQVSDYTAEVGFFARVFGFDTIALTEDYALFTHPDNGYCLSFRQGEEAMTTGLKLLLMTLDINSADAHLEETGLVPDREIREGSPVQRVIYFSAPSGMAIEIWEDPTPQPQR